MHAHIVIGLSLLFTCAGAASANTYVVTKAADGADGACNADCSLREALRAANAHAGADTVRLRHGYYALTLPAPDGGPLVIADDVTVRGLADGSTIDANAQHRVFDVRAGVTAELDDLTVREGHAAGEGAGIRTAGNLTLRRVAVAHNRVVADAAGAVDGGGIHNRGVLRVVASRVDSNVARDDLALVGGRGGGIFNAAGAQLYVYDSAIRGNQTGLDDATGFGAGVFNLGQANVQRSFFGGNDAGDGEGSAVANRAGASLLLLNCTLSNNGHDGNDGTLANGTLTVAEPRPKANVVNVTIANNNGGGVLNTGRLILRQSFVGGNYTQDGNDRWYTGVGRNCHSELGGTVTQYDTILGADGNCPAEAFVDNATVFATTLEYLQNLGGPTPVHRPRAGSGLVDGGSVDFCVAMDQRRVARPVDGDGDGVALCDIGAMEVDSP